MSRSVTLQKKRRAAPSRGGRSAPRQADAITIEGFVSAVPEPASYVLAGMERGWIDDALIDGDPKHVRSVALPMFLLVDEVAICIARGALSPEDGAAVMRDLKPKLDDLWNAIRAGEPVSVHLGKSNDPDFRIEMAFLSRALACWQQATAPKTK